MARTESRRWKLSSDEDERAGMYINEARMGRKVNMTLRMLAKEYLLSW